MGLANKIVNAIVYKQGCNTPHALSCLDKIVIKMQVSAIHKPRGMKSRTWNPSINVPLWSQEIIAGACFTLKHQYCCGDAKYHPSLVTLKILKERCF